MALRTQKALLEALNPFLQAKRYRGKINIQRPKPVHFERAKYMELTKPYFISPYKDKAPHDLCDKNVSLRDREVDNPFQRIIAEELRNWFNTSRLVAFYHMNSMDASNQYKAYVLFKKQQMHYKNYGKKTMQLAIQGTKFEPILDFYVSRNMTVFSPEPEIKKLLKVAKKFPQLVLLYAIFEGKLISKDEILEYSLIPNLMTAQAGLVQVLNSAGTTLASQLNGHQNNLVVQLEERIKQLEEEK